MYDKIILNIYRFQKFKLVVFPNCIHSPLILKRTYSIFILFLLLLFSCVTTKKSKQDVGFIGKKYHDMTARYNGYFNAKEIYKASLKKIDETNRENYNKVLPVYAYDNLEDKSLVEADMDKVIEKLTKVAALHEPSKWVDDCYVLMGKAQYLKGDLETSQETFEYFVADFNPKDPDSRVYQSPNIKDTAAERKKEANRERKIQEEERKKVKEDKAKLREQERKEREKAKKQQQKDRKKGKKTIPTPKVEKEAVPAEGVIASTSNEVPVDPDEAYIQNLEHQNKKDRQKEVEKVNSGGFLKHKPAYYDGMMGLVKAYLARDRWLEANYYLDKLEKEEGVPDHIRDEAPLLRSDYFLRQKKYQEAIPSLINSIELSDDKKQKARNSYILAQLYQLTGDAANAFKAFDNVSKFSPDFEMSLNAKINMLRNSWASNSSSETIAELEKMAKLEKYKNYRSSIFYALAEIALADGKNQEAMDYFTLALQSGDAGANKGEIYYRLATLFFGREDYFRAKNYFDSTATTMSKNDERYAEVSRYAKSLQEIAKNIQIISLQDSLLALVAMSDEELNKYAKAKVLQAWEENKATQNENNEGGFTATTSVISGNSKFFAYNQVSKQKGFQDFQKKWGPRRLEDNWRRVSKSSNSIEEVVVSEEVRTMPQLELEQEIDKIVREVPRNPDAISNVHAILEKALFELGTGFRSYLYNYSKSNNTLSSLFDRYPNTLYTVESYFYLYLNYLDLEDPTNAQIYLNKILTEFPDSDFAKYLKDPSGDNKLMTLERKIEKYYDLCYSLFEQKDFAAAQKRLEEAKTSFGTTHHMIAKYELLNAMCVGSVLGNEEYINALRSVILRYENTPEQTYAKELLRFLTGDSQAFGGELSEEALKDFGLEDDKLHYIIIILYKADGNVANEVKEVLSKYNDKYYDAARLRSTSVYLDEESKSHLILIRRFNNKTESMDYFKQASLRANEFINKDKYSFELFSINTINYREVIKQKSVNAYRVFFDRNYLGTK